jgi:ribosome biogenesis protein NSA2
LPKVRGIAEEEMFKVIKTGKHKSKSWKRMVNKATFVGEGFTRKPVKLEVSQRSDRADDSDSSGQWD